jgi:hypothetical protein
MRAGDTKTAYGVEIGSCGELDNLGDLGSGMREQVTVVGTVNPGRAEF